MTEAPTEKLVKEDSPFHEGYYLRSEGSSYKNYRWLGEVTLTFAIYLQRHLGIKTGDKVLDYGTARGYLVKALRMMSIEAYGFDISKWAIENCDPDVKDFVSNELKAEPKQYDFVVAKDVAEHIPVEKLKEIIPVLCNATKRSILIIVPLTAYTGGRYLRNEDEADATHVVRFTLNDWLLFLTPLATDFTVHGSYHMHGVKAASEAVKQSCGFFTLNRV